MFSLNSHIISRFSVRQESYRLMSLVFMVSMICYLLFGGASAIAQVSQLNAIAGTDPGIPDTIIVSGAEVDPGDHFLIRVSLVSDQELAGATIGIKWGNPDLFLDSISYTGSILEFLPEFQRPATIDNSVEFAGLSGFFIFAPPAVQPGVGTLANYWFTVNPSAPDQYIDLDSAFFPPSGDFILVAYPSNESFTPQYVGGRVKIGDPSEPSTIDASPSSFVFSALEGGVNPPFQVLNIENVGLGTLNWSATFTSAWLNVAPAGGVAPSVSQITANSIGLGVGTYFDTIVVTDPNATNSPYEIPVELVVAPPPPTISISQATFFFNAIADSSNPLDQTLIVKNSTNGSLNWTATNSESWLSVSPLAGADSTDVTMSVDITGIPFGNYQDTVIISDPNATNSPVKVIVNLSVASDLPIIALDPDTMFLVVDLNTPEAQSEAQLFDTALFVIGNDGAGAMTYSLSESVSRIFNMTPSSGNAPDTIEVEFKLLGGSPGDLVDSILVTSPEAINSPQYEYVKYHFTFTPGDIELSPDTLDFTLFECEQGASFIPQIKQESFINYGEPAPFTLEHDIDWLTSLQDFGTAPTTLGFIANATGLSSGVILDSIKVFSPLSLTTTQYLYVRLTVQEAIQPAVIFPNKSIFRIPAREGTNFQYGPVDVLQIKNFNGGCFDWTIEELISWLGSSPLSGTNPDEALLLGDATDLVFGEYDSLFTISSAEANNSPKTISVQLRVWRLFGDSDYNNRINVSDVVYLIGYIFQSGPGPEPAIYIGDVDCTGTVSVADLTYLLNYIYAHGNPPCGNAGF